MRVTVIPIAVDALETLPKALKKDWKIWKSDEELKPQHCEDQPEY